MDNQEKYTFIQYQINCEGVLYASYVHIGNRMLYSFYKIFVGTEPFDLVL
jgi:hypothetical protein